MSFSKHLPFCWTVKAAMWISNNIHPSLFRYCKTNKLVMEIQRPYKAMDFFNVSSLSRQSSSTSIHNVTTEQTKVKRRKLKHFASHILSKHRRNKAGKENKENVHMETLTSRLGFIWYRRFIRWSVKKWQWSKTGYQKTLLVPGHVFYLWLSKASLNGRRCNICNVFAHWLSPCSDMDTKRALVFGLPWTDWLTEYEIGTLCNRQMHMVCY